MSEMMTVVVVGDANLDLVLSGDVAPRFGQIEQIVDDAVITLGGSAAIVACGLARLGVPTALVAAIGDDDFAVTVRQRLVDAGVDVGGLRVRPGLRTGLSVILSAPGDRAILTHPGALTQLTVDEIETSIASFGPGHVHLASPFLVPAVGRNLRELTRGLRAQRIGTSLDTNWDPAEDWSRIVEALEYVDILLPNRAEVEQIGRQVDGAPRDADQAAALLAEFGPHIVVKDGAAGGWSLTRDGERHHAPGIVMDVVDTTGAGDSFDAGYLAARAHGVATEDDRLRWAAVAGSLSTRAAGGTESQTTLAELRSHLA